MLERDQPELLQFHGFLLAHSERLSRYERALRQLVSSGDVVLDLGCGTGILAFFALRAGAGKVFAVEETDAIEFARSLCAAESVGDRIVLLQQPSMQVELAEPADVLVADLFDCFGLQAGGLHCVADARERLLKPEATIIPSTLDLYLAPVQAEDLYERAVGFWTRPVSGIDVSSLHSCASNNRYSNYFQPAALLANAAKLAHISLREFETTAISGEVSFVIGRAGLMHGFGGWFAAQLAEGIGLTNAPGDTSTNFSQAFFPIERAVAVQEGDRVRVSLQTSDNKGCNWQVEVHAGSAVSRFDHSTRLGFPVSTERLWRLLPTYAPRLSRRGEAESFVLGLCDGQRPAEILAAKVRERYPDLFRSPAEAFGFVTSIVNRTT